MNRVVLGAFCAFLLVGIGLFWWQGRAAVERGAPPPEPAASTPGPEAIPSADAADLRGPAPPEASELSREEQRFFRYDHDRDRKITRNEMLATRTDAFRDLDADGNNLLTFEEWAVATSDRFGGMDADRNGWLNAVEFATSRPQPRATPRCAC